MNYLSPPQLICFAGEPLLISLREAAALLGYKVDGLREIVDRSRRRASGAAVRGPFIKFVQAGKNGAVRFRPEWIEEFIEANTVDPTTPTEQRRRVKPKPNDNDYSIFSA